MKYAHENLDSSVSFYRFYTEYWMCSDSKKKAYPLKIGGSYGTKDSKMIGNRGNLPTIYLK